mmetsp:Transcript_24831/g.81228  ORF Transcript_24831/g.81228 Transcript_24831/m.81228 type:complete len:296 (+) Transcript_24831:260-1147(+)
MQSRARVELLNQPLEALVDARPVHADPPAHRGDAPNCSQLVRLEAPAAAAAAVHSAPRAAVVAAVTAALHSLGRRLAHRLELVCSQLLLWFHLRLRWLTMCVRLFCHTRLRILLPCVRLFCWLGSLPLLRLLRRRARRRFRRQHHRLLDTWRDTRPHRREQPQLVCSVQFELPRSRSEADDGTGGRDEERPPLEHDVVKLGFRGEDEHTVRDSVHGVLERDVYLPRADNFVRGAAGSSDCFDGDVQAWARGARCRRCRRCRGGSRLGARGWRRRRLRARGRGCAAHEPSGPDAGA